MFGEFVAQMMVDYQRLNTWAVNNFWSSTTALIHNDNVFRTLLFHCLPLLFVVYAIPFTNEVNVNRGGGSTKGGKRPVYDDPCIKTICVLVRNNEYILL